MRRVYLDHQATTPVLPEVEEAMRPFFSRSFGSPASFHAHGLLAREALAKAREQCAALIHAEAPEDIIFTSSGTEALNLAVKGTAFAGSRRGRHLVTSVIEHPAILGSIDFLEQHGFTSTRVPVDAAGRIPPDAVEAALTDQTILVCIHQANQDVGTLQAVREIGELVAAAGIPLLVDATASGGWLPMDVRSLGIGLLALAPHRFYGPKGVGVLYKNRRARLATLLHGGTQEGGRRAGTENVPAIVGAGVAAEIAVRRLPERQAHTARLQKALWDGLRTSIPRLRLNGPEPGPERLSTNLNVSLEFVEGEGVALAADLQGIALASGAACGGRSNTASPVLLALGLEPALAQGNILMTLGEENTLDDIHYVMEKLPRIVHKLRGMSPLWIE